MSDSFSETLAKHLKEANAIFDAGSRNALDKLSDRVEVIRWPDYKETFECTYAIALTESDINVIRAGLSLVADDREHLYSDAATNMYERFDV